ncbi:DUF6760 family protein [Streptomyces sp. MS2.AVA.5]|uniref:DUF6760 family protein n=1 Tax=Streptomyces achmelvichensis TaxID=3134111 RepID=A0ACC6PLH3_9ACTN
MRTYAAEAIHSEIAFIAYHFHWSHSELLGLDHVQRREYIGQISRINQRLREES